METLGGWSAGQQALGRSGRGRAAGRVVLAVGVVSFAALRALAGDWVVVQLTDNAYSDSAPQVSGSNVVWQGYGGIFLYDGSTTTQLTDDGYEPQVSGSNVVWWDWDAFASEIFLYDGSTTTQLTHNGYFDWAPQVSGSNVVWEGDDGSDWEIFLYDGSTTMWLTANADDDYAPQVSGSNVVWYGSDGSDYEIFLYDGSTTTQLTDNGDDDIDPQVSGSNVVWQGSDGSDYEIFLYDGSTTTQLTDNTYYDSAAQVSGSNVVWYGSDGSDLEIFLYDGGTTTQLTDNTYYDSAAQVSGSNVVWYGDDGYYEIFLYNGSSTTQLTDNGYDDCDPQVSGSNVVWHGYDGSDYEIFLAVPTSDLSRLYVDVAATGAKDGSSWTDAFGDLRVALAVAAASPSVTEIWVARGTYKPGPGRSATFQLTSGVGVYGGFDGADSPNYPGGETLLEQRDPDPNTNGTILSGDIGTPGDPNDNSYHVVTGSGTDATAILDGFKITKGNATGSGSHANGGGMTVSSGSPTVSNCLFQDNRASMHGAGLVLSSSSSSVLTNCRFVLNGYNYGQGAGIYNSGCSPTLVDCSFSANGTPYDKGGAMQNAGGTPTLIRCRFTGNVAATRGGAVNNDNSNGAFIDCYFGGNTAWIEGGAIANDKSSPDLIGCTFIENEADPQDDDNGSGGALRFWNTCSPTIRSCLFAGNVASYVGGAIGNYDSCDVTIVNCTFTGNTATGAASLYTYNSAATITNSILWGNTDGSGLGHGIGGVPPTTTYTDRQDNGGGVGNIDEDPLFVDPDGADDDANTFADNDYHLSPNSPCINAGDPNGDYTGQTDLDGEDRVLIGRVDMGADEATTTDLFYELTVTINNEGRGSVVIDPNDPNHPPYIFVVGTVVTLTGEPNEDASFNKWKMHDPLDANNDYTDANNPTTLVMDRDWEVKAAFKCGSELGPMLPMILVGLGLFVVVRRRA